MRFNAHDPPTLKGRLDPMVAGNCFLLVGKDTSATITIITQASAVAATITRTSATVGQEGGGGGGGGGGGVTSKGFRHIFLRHTWEEGTRWSGQPWLLEEE